jgi:ATP-binding cassette, subfamily B, bacterial MsbA
MLSILASLLERHRHATAAVIALGLLASLAEGFGLGLLIPLVYYLGDVSNEAPASGSLGGFLASMFAGVPRDSRLPVIAAALFAIIALKAALGYSASRVGASVEVRIGHRLRQRIFDYLLTVDFRTLTTIGSARILTALHTESWRTVQAVTTLLGAVVTAGTLLVYLVLLLLISWRLTLVAAGLMIVIAIFVRSLMHGVRRLGAQVSRVNAELARRMDDGAGGIEVIRACAREDYERGRFDASSWRLSELLYRLGSLSGAVFPIYEVLAAAVLVAVVIFSARTSTTVAPLLVFVFVLYRLEPKVKELHRARLELASLEAAVRETVAMSRPDVARARETPVLPVPAIDRGILFEVVTLQYGGRGPPALADVSLELGTKSLVALVGRSGAGKSTLVRLLLRFYEPTGGRILVDGEPLSRLDPDAWRERIAVVPQRVFLFNESVHDNIAYGRLGASRDEVIEAARAAGAHEFILGLPSGYDTRIGELGIGLSGGEEQRIALARALLRRPRLLILDEATNALDSFSEHLVQRALAELRKQCLVLVIAHRMSTVEHADRIVVLDAGRIVEQGACRELLARDGLFARMYRLQEASGWTA